MYLRRYLAEDCADTAQLFYTCVHTVAAADYTPQQLDAWAPHDRDLVQWGHSFDGHYALVACLGEQLVGFGDVDPGGYLDRLYVHAQYQRQGIATALCDAFERAVRADTVTVHASLTARGFFERRGYKAVRRQQVVRHGITLENWVMCKRLAPSAPGDGAPHL